MKKTWENFIFDKKCKICLNFCCHTSGESTESSISPKLANDSLLSHRSDSVYDESVVELSCFKLIPPSDVKQVLFSPLKFRSRPTDGISLRFGILSCLLLSGNRKVLQVGINKFRIISMMVKLIFNSYH
jgi:hypothetical protein